MEKLKTAYVNEYSIESIDLFQQYETFKRYIIHTRSKSYEHILFEGETSERDIEVLGNKLKDVINARDVYIVSEEGIMPFEEYINNFNREVKSSNSNNYTDKQLKLIGN